MVIPTYRWGSECWYDARLEDERAKPSWRRIRISARTLDSFLDKPEIKISFIKCDANFHELQCLRGGMGTLRRSKPALLIEINPNPDDSTTTAFETFALLRNAGYEVYWLGGKSLRRRRTGGRSQNYFFMTPDHIRLLREKDFLLISDD